MGKSNTEQLKIAQKYIGNGGARFRKWAGLPAGAAYCNAFVSYIFSEAGNASLYCNGKKMTYCPTSISWCYKNLAQIPIYLAMPMDVIYFDWEPNGQPNHIGFARERVDATKIKTLEGNTSGGIVAYKTRPVKYVEAVFRPHYKATYKIGSLTVDGVFGYNSIAMLQKALKIDVDGILGLKTVKALQKKAGVTADGQWGTKTSKAVQKMVGVKQDGYFGPNSVKALQEWINAQNKVTKSTPSTVKTPTLADKIMDACKTQAEWMKNYSYGWEGHPTIAKSKKKGTCVTYVACVLQRLGYLKSGECVWHTESGKVYGNNSKMTVLYPNKTIKAYKSKLKAGDIIMAGDKGSVDAGGNSHIFILTGKWDGGSPYMWDNYSATRVKNKKSGVHTYPGSKKIIAVVRLK